MKKIIAIMALLASSVAMADSMNMMFATADTEGDANVQRQFKIGVKHNINANLDVDGSIIQTQTDNTYALGTRVEAGLTPKMTVSDYGLYTRVALGEKYSSKTRFTYYSVEPGVTKAVGPVVLNLGYRWRQAVDVDTNNDKTHTVRYGVTYPFNNKKDSVALLFDNIRGSVKQDVVAVQYVHNF